jgi:hypothetical protein
VADGIFDGDLAFRLTTRNVLQVFGNNLDVFAQKAWESFYSPSSGPGEDWRCFAFLVIFEINDEKPDTEPPTFRGHLPMDERLLTIATSNDFWVG